jgi:hypothetical protein
MSSIINSSIDYTMFAAKSWQEKMDKCNECYCCERHNVQKPRYVLPTVHEFDAIDVLDITTEAWRLGLCMCKCRTLVRLYWLRQTLLSCQCLLKVGWPRIQAWLCLMLPLKRLLTTIGRDRSKHVNMLSFIYVRLSLRVGVVFFFVRKIELIK